MKRNHTRVRVRDGRVLVASYKFSFYNNDTRYVHALSITIRGVYSTNPYSPRKVLALNSGSNFHAFDSTPLSS